MVYLATLGVTKGEKLVGVAPSSDVATVTATVGVVRVAVGIKEAADLALSCFKRSEALVTLELVSLRPQ